MTQEEKQILLKDLCARLPYGVKVYDKYAHPHAFLLKDGDYKLTAQNIVDYLSEDPHDYNKRLENIKPYLRPMSSMTEEETEEYRSLSDEVICTYGPYNTECKFHCVRLGIKPDNPHECIDDYLDMDAIDWLNAHHFDYRGLIEEGLAIEAPEGMYENF